MGDACGKVIHIDALVMSGELLARAVFVFGHCRVSEEIIGCLLENGISVAAILDNNEVKQGGTFRGIPIVGPQTVLGYGAAESIVLTTGKHGEAMRAQLRRMGYGGDVVSIGSENSFATYSLSEEVFRSKKERVLRGIKTLETLRRAYPAAYIVICPYDAMGDVYWALAYLPAYCEKHGIRETAVIVTGTGCGRVAGLFASENIRVIDRPKMDELVQAVLFTREHSCIIAHHDRPYTDRIIKYLDKNFLSFIDYYKYAVYGLDNNTAAASPALRIDFSEKYRFKKGRTVILSPYAKSVIRVPDAFWETLARQYAQAGWDVWTNVTGEEKPINGTKPLLCPINQIIAAAEYAGCFVGLRSGLCDVLTTAKCAKVMVFAEGFYSTTGVRTDAFFDLPGWEKIIWRPETQTEEPLPTIV